MAGSFQLFTVSQSTHWLTEQALAMGGRLMDALAEVKALLVTSNVPCGLNFFVMGLHLVHILNMFLNTRAALNC